MNYQISSDNIDLSESMKVLAKEKFAKFENKLTDKEKETSSVRIVLNRGQAPDTFCVKMDVNVKGKTYFSDETDFSLEGALIRCVGELERMWQKDTKGNADWKAKRNLKRNIDLIV